MRIQSTPRLNLRSRLTVCLAAAAGLSGCVNPTWRGFPTETPPRPYLPLAVKSPFAPAAVAEPCVDCEPPEFQLPAVPKRPMPPEEE